MKIALGKHDGCRGMACKAALHRANDLAHNYGDEVQRLVACNLDIHTLMAAQFRRV